MKGKTMEPDQEMKLSEMVLGELEVGLMLSSKLKEVLQEVRQIIAGDGDPEQNLQENAILLKGKINTEYDFYWREIGSSAGKIYRIFKDTTFENLGVEENEDDNFRRLNPTNKDVKKQD